MLQAYTILRTKLLASKYQYVLLMLLFCHCICFCFFKMCVVAFAVAFAAALAVALALAWLATLDGSDAHSSQNHVWASERNDEQDQRFSTVAASLMTAPTLEDPEEMRDWLLEHITPPRGRRLIVEILPCTMDFKAWQAPLDIQMTGITSTHWQPHANHVWRFVKRGDICGYSGSDTWNIEWGCEEWKGLEAHPKRCGCSLQGIDAFDFAAADADGCDALPSRLWKT